MVRLNKRVLERTRVDNAIRLLIVLSFITVCVMLAYTLVYCITHQAKLTFANNAFTGMMLTVTLFLEGKLGIMVTNILRGLANGVNGDSNK